MAQRRMFSPAIVCSDAFLDMPVSARDLYYQLGMRADDDGFVNPRGAMRLVGASGDDLKVLIAKRFVLPFENGVVVMKHWKVNNLIKNDRYHPTIYQEQLSLLEVKKNGSYTEGFQNGSRLEPEVRLGKVRLGKPIADAKHPLFIFKDYLTTMKADQQRHIQLIALFFEEKKLHFTTKEQVQLAIKRHLRDARDLSKFPPSEVARGVEICRNMEGIDWTLGTIVKMLIK